ncbi:MAG: gliding motility-associated protein GldE [Cyclobacteriaceae bacterium]
MEPPSIEDPLPTSLLAISASADIPFLIFTGIIILVLLILSGLVSGSEIAYFSLTGDEIDSCEQSRLPKENRIVDLLANPRRLLATILILNNLINISIVTLSTYATWHITGSTESEGTTVAILSLSITAAIILFGEIIPKVYANHNRKGFASITSGFLKFFHSVFKPVSWVLMSMSNVVERKFEKKGYNVSVDELNHALDLTTEQETTPNQKDILKGIVNFSTLSVKQVMKSRMDITAFDVDMDFHELMDQINKNSYSRIPVYNETIDKIEGILYAKDLLPHVEKEEDFKWLTLLRPGFFVPESKKIDSLFKDFQEKRVHMAIVVDEYGGTSGLITLEDIIEEIVGEINDEFDEVHNEGFSKLDDNTYIFEGKTSLNDFCKAIDVDGSEFETVKGESESLGGLLLELNNKLPHAGEVINFDRFTFTAVAVDHKKIKRVRVFINPKQYAE